MSIVLLKQALFWGINELNEVGIDSTRLDAEILLGFVLGLNREKVLTNQELRIKNKEWGKFKKLVKKRAKHYPIAYLTGSKEFYGIDFFVNENVLVPRPETELLVEEVIEESRIILREYSGQVNNELRIIEIGTGSGCISLTLAKYLPQAKITAVDISEKALKVARRNLRNAQYPTSNIQFKKSNLLSNIKTKPDIIVANLPYLTKSELNQKSITREPVLALYGGKDGMELYEKLFQQIKNKWYRRGLINQIPTTVFIEIGEKQSKSLKKYIQDLFPKARIQIKKDLAQKDRVVIIEI